MEKNKINFITGETYTLAELFSGNRRIVIPDLQRDYCWGDETNQKSTGKGELVTDFVNNLMEQFEANKQDTLNLGMFYGYEVPANHIQLCDGQQRLTTLYLLLGMLNKKVGKFQQHLISDFEYYEDDKEPYLNYAIRESSLYFLSDLVCKFFILNDDNVDSITKADWFFNDYNFDPSICSIITALKKIEKLLVDKETEWLTSFGDWLLNKLTFLYFDMGDRKNGEETFVIINTTGEPLSATQNLKPLVINAEINKGIGDIDKKWEEIETWFWNNRQGDNDTADAGFEEFLRWVSIIEQKNKKDNKEAQEGKKNKTNQYLIQQILKGEGECGFPYTNISFRTISDYWKAFIWIMENDKLFPFKYPFKDMEREGIMSPKANKDVNGRKAIGQNVCFVLLPLLSFVYKYRDTIKTDEEIQRNAKRVYEFFANLISIDNVSKAVNNLVREALRIIDELKKYDTIKGDIVAILDSSEKISEQILSEEGEEMRKLKILRQDTSHRHEIEEAFWKIQRHEVWQGEIMPLLECAKDTNGMFVFGKFKKYERVFNDLFPSEIKDEKNVDIYYLLRRCMILCPGFYELEKTGRHSFGWEGKEWKKLLSDNNCSRMEYLFQYVLQQQPTLGEYPNDVLKKFIKEESIKQLRSSDIQNKPIEFAEDDYLLSFTKGSEGCYMSWVDNDWGIYVSPRMRISRRNASILMVFDGSYENNDDKSVHKLNDKGWCVWYWVSRGFNCVVFQCDKIGIKLDVWFQSSGEKGGGLNIEMKSIDDRDISDSFPKIMDELQGFDKKDGNVLTKEYETFDIDDIKKMIETTMTVVNDACCNNMEIQQHDGTPTM